MSEVAPFLLFDEDPYIIVGADGGLYWMMDGFTTSDHYPYSRHLMAGNRSLNYIRNSVKAVIDAYNGTVHFYIFDSSDPLILAYRNMFPQLFSDAKDMLRQARSRWRIQRYKSERFRCTDYCFDAVANVIE